MIRFLEFLILKEAAGEWEFHKPDHPLHDLWKHALPAVQSHGFMHLKNKLHTGKRGESHTDIILKHKLAGGDYTPGFYHTGKKEFVPRHKAGYLTTDDLPATSKVGMLRKQFGEVEDYEFENPQHPEHSLWKHGMPALKHRVTGQIKAGYRGESHNDIRRKIKGNTTDAYKDWDRGFYHPKKGTFHTSRRLHATDLMTDVQRSRYEERLKERLRAPGMWESIGNWNNEDPEHRKDLKKHGVVALRHKKYQDQYIIGKKGEDHATLRDLASGGDINHRRDTYHHWERGFWHSRKKFFVPGHETTLDAPDMMTDKQYMRMYGHPRPKSINECAREFFAQYILEAGMKSGYEDPNHPEHDLWKNSSPALKHRHTGEIFKGRRGWDTHDDLRDKIRHHPQTVEDLSKGIHGGWEQGYWHKEHKKFIPHKEVNYDSPDLMTPAQRRQRGIMG